MVKKLHFIINIFKYKNFKYIFDNLIFKNFKYCKNSNLRGITKKQNFGKFSS